VNGFQCAISCLEIAESLTLLSLCWYNSDVFVCMCSIEHWKLVLIVVKSWTILLASRRNSAYIQRHSTLQSVSQFSHKLPSLSLSSGMKCLVYKLQQQLHQTSQSCARGFGLNAPCLSHCVLHPLNTYRASCSVWGFVRIVDWNMWAANTTIVCKRARLALVTLSVSRLHGRLGSRPSKVWNCLQQVCTLSHFGGDSGHMHRTELF